MGDSGSPPEKNDFKSLLVKGVVGAVTLAGTTAIPIIVQQSLQHHPPTPTASPAATVPAQPSPTPAVIAAPVQVSPPPDSPQIRPTEVTYPAISQDEINNKPGKKAKKKHQDD
jgi:hypothetical protein